jgi:hypothetical protein
MSEDTNKIIIYNTANGETKIEVNVKDETVWLSQDQMAELFDKGRSTITEHIQNVFREGELDEKAVCRDFRHTTQHGAIKGKTQEQTVKYYNLDVIISVGYRVKSLRGTQFRIWATQKLKEYIIKGFTMDDQRLASGQVAKTYFEELEERIRKIRTSEANFYQKVKDVFATSADYNPKTDYAQKFFAVVQNKLLFYPVRLRRGTS